MFITPKEVDLLAGNKSEREQNYEIKYLRKVLGQVDNRIRVPQSIDAASLRSMLDGIEPPTPRDAARHRPRWLSLQSGIAYAAAFALVVALFYSTRLYRPEIINGGMYITESEQATPMIALADEAAPSDADTRSDANVLLAEPESALTGFDSPPDITPVTEGDDSRQAPAAPNLFGVGGSGAAVLLLEQDQKAYYARVNDATDPDRTSPVTLEIVDQSSQEIVAQVNVADMHDIQRCFVSQDKILIVGQGDDGIVINAYSNGGDNADSGDLAEQISLLQPGQLIDARFYKDVVHVVTLVDEPTGDSETVVLPHADIDASETCVITAIDLVNFETAQKSFVGSRGTVQLYDFIAYIHYKGEDTDSGAPKDYIGQILLEGMDIELGTVS